MKDVSGPSRPKPVVDASVVIGLSKIGQFHLLQDLFAMAIVPKAVLDEVLAKEDAPGAAEVKEAIDAGWVEVVAVETDPSFSNLGAGEAATLTYAHMTGALALLDDQVARSHALKHQVAVSRTVNVLIAAKQEGFVEVIEPLLDELRKRNFHLSEDVVQNALAEAGERPRSVNPASPPPATMIPPS